MQDYDDQRDYAEEAYNANPFNFISAEDLVPLSPEEMEAEIRAIAEHQALRDEGNVYTRRQVDDR